MSNYLTATLLVACSECHADVEVEITLASEGPTKVHEALCDVCIDRLSEPDPDAWEDDECSCSTCVAARDERDGPAREPFTSDVPKGWDSVDTSVEDDDCPF